MRIPIARAAVLAFLLLLPSPEPGLSAPATVVVPGKALGPIRIGMKLDDAKTLMRAFGPVTSRPAIGGQAICGNIIDPSLDICVFDSINYYVRRGQAPTSERIVIRTPGLVIAASTIDARFKTSGGLGVDSSLADFVRVYGAAPVFSYESTLPPELRKPGVGVGVARWQAKGIDVLVKWPGTSNVLPKDLRQATVIVLTVFMPR